MAGYLEGYGAGDERRERIWKRIGLALLILLVASGAAYWFLRNYREERQLKTFFDLVRSHKHQEAYAMWACHDEATKCRDYPYEKFLEDWGPNSSRKIEAMQVVRTRSCSNGIIRVLRFGERDEEFLYVNRADLKLSTIPWAQCNPRFQAPAQ